VHYFWLCFEFGFVLCVRDEAAFSGSHVLFLGAVRTLSPNVNKFTNFSDEQIDLKPSPVWQDCALPVEKRG